MYRERLTELRLEHGERLPVITVSGDAPPVLTSVYTLTALRTGGRSPNTIAAHLRAIITARRWAHARGLSLEERMQEGRLLTLREVEDLVCALRSRQARRNDSHVVSSPAPDRRRAGGEALRRQAIKTAEGVDPAVAANRVRFVRDYLVWLAQHSSKPNATTEIKQMADSLTARAKGKADTIAAPRRGLDFDQREQLLKLVDPNSPANPFSYPPTQLRNSLIVRLLYASGGRRGEIAGVKIRDIDPKASTIAIHCRGDDPDDSRAAPPRAKTAAREVPIEPTLIRDLSNYVLDIRRVEPAAKHHPFLFVAHRGAKPGAPLSTRQIGKIFEVLSETLGFDVHAHLLRYTWNDRFSELQDAQKAPRAEAHEERVRAVLMGWSPKSKMPALYSRRHTARAADKAMRKLAGPLMSDE